MWKKIIQNNVSSLGYKISIQISIAFCLSTIRERKEKWSQQKICQSITLKYIVLFLLEKMTSRIEGHKRILEWMKRYIIQIQFSSIYTSKS